MPDKRRDECVEVFAGLAFGDRDEQLIGALGIHPAEIEAGQEALGLERLDDARRVAAAHAHGELVERRRRGIDERVAGERGDLRLQVLGLGQALPADLDEALLAEHAHADGQRERAEAACSCRCCWSRARGGCAARASRA